MKLNFFLVLLLVLFAITGAYSQGGYIISDSTYSQGLVIDQSVFKNNREVRFSPRNGQPFVVYLPKDLLEYGISKKDVYVKRVIKDGTSTNPYFLRRLVSGDRRLYEFKTGKRTRYFIERDSTLIEVTKGSLAGDLSGILNPCESFQNSVALARYTKGSLMRIVSLNNSCYNGLLPRFRTGILFGYSGTSITVGSSFDHTFLTSNSVSPFFGAFIDVPLGIKPSWFINFQAYYQKSIFAGFIGSPSQDVNYSFQRSTINFPLFLRYRSKGATWRPFLNLGPTTSFAVIQESYWITSTKKGSLVTTALGNIDGISRIQINPTLGVGLEVSLTRKISASLELRYAKLIAGNTGAGQTFGLMSSIYF